jgi:hypothetical protein
LVQFIHATDRTEFAATLNCVAPFGNLHGEFGRYFVIGVSDARTGIAEDLTLRGISAKPSTQSFCSKKRSHPSP